MKKIISILIIITLSLCSAFYLLVNNIEAKAETTPSLSIYKSNISYSESLYLLYAVSYEGIDINTDEVQMLYFNTVQDSYTKGNESYVAYNEGTMAFGTVNCLLFYSNGIAAKQMTDDIYARAYVVKDGVEYYSEVYKYSILEHAYKTMENSDTTELMSNFMKAMLEYGSLAQQVLNYNTSRLADATYYNIKVVDGTLEDGFTQGRYQNNEKVTLTAAEKSGYTFTGWTNSLGEVVSTDKQYQVTVTESNTYTANYVIYINEVDITVGSQYVDYPAKTPVVFEGDNFTYSYYNPSQVTITITVTLEEGYAFGDDFVFIYNGKTISSSKYTISGNVLTYKYADPGWSIIV